MPSDDVQAVTAPPPKHKSLQARIVAGSVVLLSGSSLLTGINLAYNFAVARFLGPQGYGHASAVYTLLTLISAVTLAFQIISAKVVAQQQSQESKSAVYRDFHRAAWACGFVVALLLFVFQNAVANYLKLPTPLLVDFLAIGAAFYVPLGTRRGYIQGAYGFRNLATNLVIEGAVRLCGSVAAVLLGFGVVGVIAANAAAMAVSYFVIAPRLEGKIANPVRFSHAFREMRVAMIFFAGQVLINNCDIVLVKHFFLPKTAGLYAAIAMVGRVIFAFSQAVINSMFPVVAGTRDEERRSVTLIATSLLLVLSIGAVLSIGLRFTPAWVWTTFFGSGFALPGQHGFPYLLSLYAITTVVYSLSVVIITYEMSYKIANTSWLQLIFSGLVVIGICRFHDSLQQVIVVQTVLMGLLLLFVAVPFFLGLRKSALSLRSEGMRPIRLLRRVSEDEAIAEFLRGDFEHQAYSLYHHSLRDVVYSPDVKNAGENTTRKALLFLRHRSLWKELPADTEWFEAELKTEDFERIRVFPRAQWRKLARGNFGVPQVLDRIRKPRLAEPSPFAVKLGEIQNRLHGDAGVPGAVLLIGVNEKDPLTILDGNHRFIAAALNNETGRLRVLCGLSPRMTRCCWYKTNLFTLTRYAGNLAWHFVSYPGPVKEHLKKAST